MIDIEIAEKIKEVENYNFTFLKSRFSNLFPELDEYQYLLIEDTLRDYYIANYLIKKNVINIGINKIPPPNNIVDELWHLHIIYTKNYFKFCDDFFGFYLHHTPTNEDKKEIINYDDLFKLGNLIKEHREYKLKDLNEFKNKEKFSLLSQINDYLNEVPYEVVLK